MGGLLILRDFDISNITKRQSEDLRREFTRLEILKWKTMADYGTVSETTLAKVELQRLTGKGSKRKESDGGREEKRTKKSRIAS